MELIKNNCYFYIRQLDPIILGLERDTDFSLEHRIERAVDIITHMDLLMGRGWDVRTICGSEGYRVILTVEVSGDHLVPGGTSELSECW